MRYLSRRTSATEDGFTLVELSIASAILLVVVGAILGSLSSTQRSSQFVQERGRVLDEMRISMERMSKEIRQAEAIDAGSTASVLQIDTFVGGVSKTVVYEAEGTTLARSVVGEAGSYTLIEDELSSPSVFAYTLPESGSPVTDAKVIGITLTVEPEQLPETVLSLTSEVRLRNVEGATA